MSPDFRLARWALLALAVSAGSAACSGTPGTEDDQEDGSGGSEEDGSGGTSEDGSGGESEDGSGGESEDGSGGSEEDGSGGTSEDGSGGLGGLGGDGSGGEQDDGSGGVEASGGSGSGGDGSGGDGSGGAPGPDPIVRGTTEVLTEAQDIRGLYFTADGRLYASGFTIAENNDQVTVVLRFDADGNLDENWGDFGVAELNLVPYEEDTSGETPVVINDGLEESLGVVELADGNVLVQVNLRRYGGPGSAGPTRPTRVGVLKLDAEGEPVTAFGGNGDGVALVEFGYTGPEEGTWSDTSWGLALDSESEPGVEKVVVFGFGTALASTTRTDNDRFVTRLLTADGTRDPNFNGNQPFAYNSNTTLSDNGRRGLVLDGGKILSSGYTNFGDGLGNHVMLIQLTAAGTADPTFGFGTSHNGVARFNPFIDDGGAAECYNVAVQATGRVVTTGYGTATATNTASSLGYLTSVRQDMVNFGVFPTGLDDDFGTDGHWAVQSEADPPEAGTEALAAERFEERGRDVIALADDRLVFAGRYDLRPALIIGRADGGLDETTGDGLSGRFIYSDIAPDTSHFYAVARTADGSKVVATTNENLAVDGVLFATLEVGD